VPETITGLPLHPLVVHFVVVLLPIASLGALLCAVWPAVRRRFGWLTVAAAAVATALVPVATMSGDNLKQGLGGGNPLIDRHEELASLMLWWALGLFVAVTALMLVHNASQRRAADPGFDEHGGEGGAVATETRRSTGLSVAMIVAALATVALAVGTGVHIYRVGDAGARTVWEDVGKNLK
jgi:uncharacterized membrane protein